MPIERKLYMVLDLESSSEQNAKLVNEIRNRYHGQNVPIQERIRGISRASEKRILFVYPPKWKGIGTAYGEFLPLSLFHRQAEAISAGMKTRVLDVSQSINPQEELLSTVESFQPHVIAYATTSSSQAMALTLAHALRQQKFGGIQLIGGQGITHAFFELRKILGNSCPIDIFFLGDAETSFPVFVETLRGRDRLENSDGIGIMGEIDRPTHPVSTSAIHRVFPSVKQIIDSHQEAFPIILFDKVKMGKLREPMARIQTATKCGYSCGFCATSRVTGNQTRKPVEETMEYIKALAHSGIRTFFFEEATFTIDKIGTGVFTYAKNSDGTLIEGQQFSGWTDQFLNQMIKLQNEFSIQNDRLRFGIQTRVDSLTRERIQELARAGCTQVYFGVETLDQKALIRMKKGTLNAESNLHQTITELQENGINATASLIAGEYTGSMDSFEYTLQKLVEWNIAEIFIQAAAIYPETGDWNALPEEQRRNVVLSYLRPDSEGNPVSTRKTNPEDSMQYTLDSKEEIDAYYTRARQILESQYESINTGHYIRKDIMNALK